MKNLVELRRKNFDVIFAAAAFSPDFLNLKNCQPLFEFPLSCANHTNTPWRKHQKI
jgi:hypothetical protein